MTDDMNTEPQEAPEPTELTEEEHTENTSEEHTEEAPTGNAEAKKYRLRLREAENQLQVLTERLNAFQRSDVLRHAGEHLDAPEDLFGVGGYSLEDFLSDDGEVSPEKVEEAAKAIVESRPGLASRVGAFDRYQGYGGAVNRELDWTSLFKTK